MEHNLFFDGNPKRIAWLIHTNGSEVDQKREHPYIYRDKVTPLQSKYIALHVGLFWGIGKFIIKNEDEITIKIEDKTMFEQLENKRNTKNKFIKTRMMFISQLLDQRKIKVNYEFLENKKINLEQRGLRPKT